MDGSTVTLLRREDMVVLDFTFSNISRSGTAGAVVLGPTTPGTAGTITAHFPPQSVLEQATLLAAATESTKRVRYSGESTVALRVLPGTTVPFTAEGLLSWAALQAAQAGTVLECVWGLFLGPATADLAWRHVTAPVTGSSGATGIWHTRIAPASTRPYEGGPVDLVGVASPRVGQPFAGSLSDAHRDQIHKASKLRSVTANGLVLSALGAHVDLAGDWDGPGITMYRHRSAGGRDIFVNVVERGFLLPFGFPVQVTTRTERRLDLGLVQAVRLTVLKPEISYEGVAALPNGGRAFPFVRVRIDRPTDTETAKGADVQTLGYWVNRADAPASELLFALSADDRLGHRVHFTAPLLFIRGDSAYGDLTAAVAACDSKANTLTLNATGRLELAPGSGTTEEKSTLDIAELRVGAQRSQATPAQLKAAGRPAAHPRLVSVGARIPALDALAPPPAAGVSAAAPGAVTGTVHQLKLYDAYVTGGLAASHQVYASLPKRADFAPPPATSGAVAALALQVSGLSAASGLVGGNLDTVAAGQFAPGAYFKPSTGPGDLPTRLLGVIDLTQLVESGAVGNGDGTSAPKIITVVDHAQGGSPTAVRTEMIWRPRIKVTTLKQLTTTGSDTLDIRSISVARYDGSPATAEVRGELRDFKLSFAKILSVEFRRIAFTGKPGTPPDLDVKIGTVGFEGDLHFLNKLREYLPSPANGPRVTVDPKGVEVGYGLAVPTVSAGVFLLQNLALSITVRLPFDGAPVRTTFTVSSRDHPFLITVSLLGGGGYFSLTVESGRVTVLEAQLEFGAAAALDLGVASGSVAITAGVYLKLKDGASLLEGFLRAVGALDVLGIITVSVEFYLSLKTIEVPKNPAIQNGATRTDIVGTAKVTVRVRVAFFSQSVSMSLERRFGGGGDPLYSDAFPTQSAWSERCAAFAALEDAS
ncbi:MULTISPECIES: hypothetical protein [Streptomyces]|uniref:hypothetical protein n=1 Tax=Streptomyces TaxID=1883 RepID=UPI000A75CD18|nr:MULTISPECIES: hypothetical protein [Streptomyces]